MLTLKFVNEGGRHVRWELVFVVEEMLCFQSFKKGIVQLLSRSLLYFKYNDSVYNGVFMYNGWALFDIWDAAIDRTFFFISGLLDLSCRKTFVDERGMVAAFNDNILKISLFSALSLSRHSSSFEKRA